MSKQITQKPIAPQTKFQGKIFALLTILIIVPCFVLYCLSIEAGGILNISLRDFLIFTPIEWVLAYFSATRLGTPLALKLARKTVDLEKSDPSLVQTVNVALTAAVMCPWMTFLATLLYQLFIPVVLNGAPLAPAVLNFVPNFLQAFVLNFPFALLSQLFFIQPLVRWLFAKIFKNQLARV